MTWTAAITGVTRDPENFNIIARIVYTDDVSGSTYTERWGSVTVTMDDIAEHARKRIRNVFEQGDTTIAALQQGEITLPPDPEPDPKLAAVLAANQKLGEAIRNAQLKEIAAKDPDVAAALADVQVAQAAVAIAVVDPVLKP